MTGDRARAVPPTATAVSRPQSAAAPARVSPPRSAHSRLFSSIPRHVARRVRKAACWRRGAARAPRRASTTFSCCRAGSWPWTTRSWGRTSPAWTSASSYCTPGPRATFGYVMLPFFDRSVAVAVAVSVSAARVFWKFADDGCFCVVVFFRNGFRSFFECVRYGNVDM